MKYIIGAYATTPSLSVENKLVENKFYNKLIDRRSKKRTRGI
jgi:hypothetical protein|tara:strand:- start:3523 stop:3648 length:126 start_codon:yes stop_codon:yes gene_type:complete